MKTTKKSTGRNAGTKSPARGFTEEERAAMKERVEEMRAARAGRTKADEESAVLAKIDRMPEPDRSLGRRLHEIVRTSAPKLSPRLWYGMPAYTKDGEVLCFFQAADKFKARYATLGFSDEAKLDEGDLWPTAFALKQLNPAEVARIVALLKRAVA